MVIKCHLQLMMNHPAAILKLEKYSLDKENRKRYKQKCEDWKSVASSVSSDIINTSDTKEVIEVHSIGKIDKEIYKCITEDIETDGVII